MDKMLNSYSKYEWYSWIDIGDWGKLSFIISNIRRGAEKLKFLIELCVGLQQQRKKKMKKKKQGVVCPDMTQGFRTHMLDHNYGSRSAQWQSEKRGMRKTLELELFLLHRTLQEKLTCFNEHDNIRFSTSLSHLKIWLKGYYALRTTAVMW